MRDAQSRATVAVVGRLEEVVTSYEWDVTGNTCRER